MQRRAGDDSAQVSQAVQCSHLVPKVHTLPDGKPLFTCSADAHKNSVVAEINYYTNGVDKLLLRSAKQLAFFVQRPFAQCMSSTRD